MGAPERARASVVGPTLSECDGVRYLHFGTQWVQGAMRLGRPYHLELEYQQQMMAPLLFVPRPQMVLQLGLGAAALTKFCHRHLGESRIVAVDISAAVIRVARQWFALAPDDERLRVVRADAGRYVRRVAQACDWLQVDLYDAQARGPVLDDAAFYAACRAALRPGGVAAFNLFGGASLRASLVPIRAAFDGRVMRLPRCDAGNTVVLGFAGDPVRWDTGEILRRAAVAARRMGLPAEEWLDGLQSVHGRRLGLNERAWFRL